MYKERLRLRAGIMIGIMCICAVAVAGAFYLGQTYLRIIREGKPPEGARVKADNSAAVVARDEVKTLFLNPVAVYYLQAGVYSDLQGAGEAVLPLEEMGYAPYVTATAPYRIWVGVYQKRTDTEIIKSRLREQGISSFTGSVVINGSNLRYSRGSEIFIKETAPVLEAYTAWLEENLQIFNAGEVDGLDWSLTEKQFTVCERVYTEVRVFDNELRSNHKTLDIRFSKLRDAVSAFEGQSHVFRENRDSEDYMLLQNRMLSFIDNYLLLWQEIENSSKT